MGERKVLNFYIAPDFDASIIPKMKRDWDKLVEVRTMLPFSMRCDTCGNYMYRGKKFTAKKERVKGDNYLGIHKYRFYIKCSVCCAEIAFKTDPKNSDYEMESGASRNFEVWRETNEAVEGAKAEREEEDKQDAMKSLENRTIDSKIEMDVLDALDEIKSINQRHERVDTAALLGKLAASRGQTSTSASRSSSLKDEDEKLISSIFKSSSTSSSKPPINSLTDNITLQMKKRAAAAMASSNANHAAVLIKRKRKGDDAAEELPTKSDTVVDHLSPPRSQDPATIIPQSSSSDGDVAEKREKNDGNKEKPPADALSGLMFGYGGDSEEET